MTERTYKGILKEIDRILLWSTIPLTVALGLLYAFIDRMTEKVAIIELVQGLVIEFLPIGIVFGISYFVFRRVQVYREQQLVDDLSIGVSKNLVPELQTLFLNSNTNTGYYLADFPSINWGELLDDAKQIDIFVHYFDTWIRNNDRLLENVLRRGGKIRIILPSHENKSLIKQIKVRFPEYDEKAIKAKVEKTKEKLDLIHEHAGTGSLEVFEINELGYYCGIRIDNRFLILSMYDHIRDRMKIESPTFIIKLDLEKYVGEWFDKEFQGLMERSQK